jgi:hypothetical protein
MRARLPLFVLAIATAALGGVFAACLPGDTRPVPAVIHFTVESSPAVTEGFTTVDGWHVSFERFLVSVGGMSLGGHGIGGRDADESACNSYSDARYQRLIDLVVPGQQKLSDVYGLGACGLRLRLRPPNADDLLGEGVSAQDLAFMRVEDTDEIATHERQSVHVRGLAKRDAVTIHFDWSFRTNLSLHGCADASGIGYASDVALIGGEVLTRAVVIHGEELFHAGRTDASPLRFDALAAADADGDHVITLSELGAIDGPPPEADAGFGAVDGGGPTMEQFLYEELLPRMVRLGDSAACVGDLPQMMP